MQVARARRRVSTTTTVVAVASTLVLVGLGLIAGDAATASSSSPSESSWTVYHGRPDGAGASSVVKSVTTSKRAWTSSVLNGQIYGEPLVYVKDVYVATENDTVYALSSTNGKVLWQRHLATPVPSSALPCGDVSPNVGITGTPVIDPSRNEIFVVADEDVAGKPEHFLVGLSTTSGAVELRQRVDPPGSDPAALLQRTGLNLDEGHVVFAMGGNYGDCSAYQGRVISVKETGSTPTIFTVDARPGDSQGAIWMGGAAPIVDAKGNVWVSVGNGSVHTTGQPYDDSDSVLELSVAMRLKQFFAPSDWAANNASDYDMTTAPALLSDGQVILTGKSRIVYLLNGAHLGGIGSSEATLGDACSNDIDGGPAFSGTVVYLPCLSGPVAIRVATSPPRLRELWHASVGGGPAIIAGGEVWTVAQSGVLYGLSPATGKVRQQAQIGALSNHFTTPSVGDGLLLVASSNRVVAFRATT